MATSVALIYSRRTPRKLGAVSHPKCQLNVDASALSRLALPESNGSVSPAKPEMDSHAQRNFTLADYALRVPPNSFMSGLRLPGLSPRVCDHNRRILL